MSGHTPPGSTDDPDELFDLVDAEDHVIGTVTRGEAHRNPRLLHRSVQVLVFSSCGKVLLQKRSATKDLFPGYYCASASGHVAAGDSYQQTAQRELREELGIAPDAEFKAKMIVCSPMETEITALFYARSDGPFTFHTVETDGGRWYTLDELSQQTQRRTLPLTPAAEAAIEYVLDHRPASKAEHL